MQPSKEREASDGDPMDDLDDLLDDDLAGSGGEANADSGDAAAAGTSTESARSAGKTGDSGRVGVSGRWFSAKALALALVAVGAGVFVGGLIPLIGGTIGTAGGVFVAAFLLGLVLSARRYVETGVAGATAGAASAVTSVLGVGFLPIGIDYLSQWGLPLVAVGGGVGLALALLGHYFGRDLRAGLTEDIDG
jgi:FtsH-binding integral membrane protein